MKAVWTVALVMALATAAFADPPNSVKPGRQSATLAGLSGTLGPALVLIRTGEGAVVPGEAEAKRMHKPFEVTDEMREQVRHQVQVTAIVDNDVPEAAIQSGGVVLKPLYLKPWSKDARGLDAAFDAAAVQALKGEIELVIGVWREGHVAKFTINIDRHIFDVEKK